MYCINDLKFMIMYDLSEKVVKLYEDFKHISKEDLNEFQEVIVSLYEMKVLEANKKVCCKVFPEFIAEYDKEIQEKKDNLILYINECIGLGYDHDYETKEVEQWNNPEDQITTGYWTTITSFTLCGISNYELGVEPEDIHVLVCEEERLNK